MLAFALFRSALAERAVLCVAIAALLTSCSGNDSGGGTGPITVDSVAVIGPQSLLVSDSARLTARVLSSSGQALQDRAVTWATGDNAIAVVDSTGLVRGVAPGETTITATSEGKVGHSPMLILERPVVLIEVTATPASDVVVGDTVHGEAIAYDDQGGVRTLPFTWTSSDSSVADIVGPGVIVARAVGSATITASTGDASGSIDLEVSNLRVASITLTPDTAAQVVGSSLQLVATVIAERGDTITDRRVEWLSSDSAVVQVDSTGIAEFRATGHAIVSARVDDVSGHAYMEALSASGASLAIVPQHITVEIGQPARLTAELTDSSGNTRIVPVRWEGSGGSIDEWGTIISYQPEEVTVIALADGGLRSTATVIFASGSAEPHVFDLPYDSVSIGRGHAVEISATVHSGIGFPIWEATIAWTSSAPGIASVDPSGIIRGLTNGEAWIRAQAGSARDSVHVRVTDPLPATNTVATGHDFTCALSFGGNAYCWGSGNIFGPPFYFQSTPQRMSDGLQFVALRAGWHNILALTEDGTAYAWGTAGNTADFDDPPSHGVGYHEYILSEPTPVAGGLNFKDIAAGAYHSCGLTIEGHAYCWGSGASGALGTGNFDGAYAPSQVAGGLVFTDIAVGDRFTIALTAEGVAYAWGTGMLGDGADSTTATTPTPVAGALRFAAVEASGHRIGALTESGEQYAWGRVTPSTTWVSPTLVPGPMRYIQIKVGGRHTAGITAEGEIWTWGSWALGNGSDTETLQPVRAFGGHKWVDFAAGFSSMVAIRDEGEVYEWGTPSWDPYGQTVSVPSTPPGPTFGLTATPDWVEVQIGIETVEVGLELTRERGGFARHGQTQVGFVRLIPSKWWVRPLFLTDESEATLFIAVPVDYSPRIEDMQVFAETTAGQRSAATVNISTIFP